MFILDSLFVGGLRFVLEKIADVADHELNDPERWRAMLLEYRREDNQPWFQEGDRVFMTIRC